MSSCTGTEPRPARVTAKLSRELPECNIRHHMALIPNCIRPHLPSPSSQTPLQSRVQSMTGNMTLRGRWPEGARAAICFTMDNMGEAADLNRNLWPESEPIGQHYTVTQVLPQMLRLLQKYNVPATYFIESWNTNVYEDFILNQITPAGHEIGWHAWQHEAWAKLKDEDEERANFQKSFGQEGIKKWLDSDKFEPYRGFRPPGGIINDATLRLCREFGMQYISPAGEHAATLRVGAGNDTITILPFKWATVDAYFYMESFAGLRKMKGEYPTAPQPAEVLAQRYCTEIDGAIESGDFLSVLFHPFLTNKPERIEALEFVLKHIAKRRDQGQVWVARCKDVDEFIRKDPSVVGSDPSLDLSSWR